MYNMPDVITVKTSMYINAEHVFEPDLKNLVMSGKWRFIIFSYCDVLFLLITNNSSRDTIFWDVTPCSVAELSQRFDETTVNLCQPTRIHIQAGRNVHSHRFDKHKFPLIIFY
jgi:hypothetical protein